MSKEYKVTWGPWVNHDNLPCGMTDQDKVEKLIIDDLVKSGRVVGGHSHQELEDGCPYINGEPMTYSLRGWGRVMAEARNIVEDVEDHPYDYCNFAWSTEG